MRTYIIGNDGITAVPRGHTRAQCGRDCNWFERGVAHRSLRRQPAAGAVECAGRCRKAEEGWRPRCADRPAVVGNGDVAGTGAATPSEALVEAGGVIAMLHRPEGATVDEVASTTGWQRHTVRGVFSGALKNLGLTLASAKKERGRVYRVADRASPVKHPVSASARPLPRHGRFLGAGLYLPTAASQAIAFRTEAPRASEQARLHPQKNVWYLAKCRLSFSAHAAKL
jgi:hypothetical protein